MAGVNLIREARVFFTKNVDDITGKVATSNFSTSNTWEFQVLDGMSFSQNTSTETVSINEAGTDPVRGQRVFNTALEPVDFSFSTYMRPAKVGSAVTAEEKYLWNAFAAEDAVGGTAPAWTEGSSTTPAILDFDNSNHNKLQKFGIVICMAQSTIVLHNCALESVSIDFGIDAIATLAWTGRATEFEQLDATTFTPEGNISGGLSGSVTPKITDGKYLANKLSIATITYNEDTFSIPITGGNLTISNNLSYLTPATVGVVNKPLTHFTGARTYSGSLTAYLRRGTAGDTGDLFSTILTSATSDDQNQAEVKISIGGAHDAATRVDIIAPTAMLSVPNIATEQVVSATFGFTPQGSASIESTDELTIKYYHPI